MPNSEHFKVGQLVDHQRFDYRGVIYAVDAQFSLTNEWYEMMANSMPPRDAPWYHVLVDNSPSTTYVAERNLHLSHNHRQINHPLLGQFFDEFSQGGYHPKKVSRPKH